MMRLPELKHLLTYDNESVVNRFHSENPERSIEQARYIFKDLLAWLWLGAKRKNARLETHMIGPLHVLDAMWHVFILDTVTYHAFCLNYFGQYLHHHQQPIGYEYVISPDELSEFLNDCYDYLGEDWLGRNFA